MWCERAWALLLSVGVQWLPQGKLTSVTIWAVSCPSHFFRKHDFTWKKQLTDKLVIYTWVLADIFSKKGSLEATTLRKTTGSVCCQWQNPSFQVRILGELCLPLWAWQLSNTVLNDFSNDMSVMILMNVTFKYGEIKCINI